MLINQNSVKKNRSNYRTIEVKTMFPEKNSFRTTSKFVFTG